MKNFEAHFDPYWHSHLGQVATYSARQKLFAKGHFLYYLSELDLPVKQQIIPPGSIDVFS